MQQINDVSVEQSQEQLRLELAQVIADFRKPSDILSFLTLFLSEAELLIVAKRLAIFKRLQSGESYLDIQKELGVSSATVSAVAQLKNASFAQTVSEHLNAQDWAENTANKLRNFFSSNKA